MALNMICIPYSMKFTMFCKCEHGKLLHKSVDVYSQSFLVRADTFTHQWNILTLTPNCTVSLIISIPSIAACTCASHQKSCADLLHHRSMAKLHVCSPSSHALSRPILHVFINIFFYTFAKYRNSVIFR